MSNYQDDITCQQYLAWSSDFWCIAVKLANNESWSHVAHLSIQCCSLFDYNCRETRSIALLWWQFNEVILQICWLIICKTIGIGNFALSRQVIPWYGTSIFITILQVGIADCCEVWVLNNQDWLMFLLLVLEFALLIPVLMSGEWNILFLHLLLPFNFCHQFWSIDAVDLELLELLPSRGVKFLSKMLDLLL